MGIFQNFCMKEYDVDVKNREVVDVGANIGDTPIWFSINGARHVYAFEPLPEIYSLALENIKLNGIEDKINIINAGVNLRMER
ncbi:FkbM family methyltransferase [Saccharolobus solfataricus]|uniref:FkbM family methyltransferase n=2 Tax=Saccharolobus solfataricus TaxID=2287 RepID=A0A3G2LQY3_SACSO|nr:FkbM family methyltransferase [Saccharolobus solfataricus]AYN75783.1 FkbM family methyltransferase [Saccharolobus solfataricus]AYP18618.1 FkbM family methyltransferase [Saccharolobus solfataricus]AZF79607.1 FkbM family methyltransferase [Saccharolobus solfataricus]AZF82212.1 FkbM family methyltransferase [Saccharolobus solfataricus]